MNAKDRSPTTIVILGMKDTMPVPSSDSKDNSPISLEAKIKDMIDCIESGYPSAREWIALNKFYRTLRGRLAEKPGDTRSKRLISMIEPIMSKYGQHGVPIKDT